MVKSYFILVFLIARTSRRTAFIQRLHRLSLNSLSESRVIIDALLNGYQIDYKTYILLCLNCFNRIKSLAPLFGTENRSIGSKNKHDTSPLELDH